MIEHRPGPWKAEPFHKAGKHWFVVRDGSGIVIAETNHLDVAWLIALMPDMYNTLKAVMRVTNQNTDEFKQAKALIAKADGEP